MKFDTENAALYTGLFSQNVCILKTRMRSHKGLSGTAYHNSDPKSLIKCSFITLSHLLFSTPRNTIVCAEIPSSHHPRAYASAENQMLFMLEHIGANQCFKFLNVIDFSKMLCHGMETEAVEGLEVDVGFHGGKNTQ